MVDEDVICCDDGWPRLKFVSAFIMGGALLVKLTRGTKMQESPENNLRTEDSIHFLCSAFCCGIVRT